MPTEEHQSVDSNGAFLAKFAMRVFPQQARMRYHKAIVEVIPLVEAERLANLPEVERAYRLPLQTEALDVPAATLKVIVDAVLGSEQSAMRRLSSPRKASISTGRA
jgi:hypothetical protein